MSPPATTRSGLALRSGPERGGGGVRGRYVGGRPWACPTADVRAGAAWDGAPQPFPPPPRWLLSQARRLRRALRCRRPPQPRSWATAGSWSRSGCEAEQRPLLRSLFRRGPRRTFGGSQIRSISSPLGCGVRPLPENLLASTFRGGDGLGGGCPAPCVPCGGPTRALG